MATEGVKPFAPSLDTVGWIAEEVAVLQATATALGIKSQREDKIPEKLRIGFYKTPYFDQAQAETLTALEQTIELMEAAGHKVEPVEGPSESGQLNSWQDTLMYGEGCAMFSAEFLRDPSIAHQGVRNLVENKKEISTDDMLAAQNAIARLRPQFDQALSQYDAWLTPAVPGVAPLFTEGNGLATFNRLFTALHVPCVTLPGFTGPNGLPVGIQLVGARFADAQLLGISKQIESLIKADRT